MVVKCILHMHIISEVTAYWLTCYSFISCILQKHFIRSVESKKQKRKEVEETYKRHHLIQIVRVMMSVMNSALRLVLD